MKVSRELFFPFLVILFVSSIASAQTPASISQPVMPRLVTFSGTAIDVQRKPVAGTAGVTFAIYRDQYDGAPLWLETQNIVATANGSYSVLLGATKSEGLPLELFTSGEARWLGVRVNGGEEQPRVLLLSVPYALKAADAETLGGLPLSAFVLAAPASVGSASAATVAPSATASASPTNPAVTGVGAKGAISLWDSASDITSSAITQTGSGSTARIGINITTPSATLDVKGTSNFRGTLNMPSAGLATVTAGKTSYPLIFTTSAFNSGSASSVTENFRWQAEPVGNNSAKASGALNLLFYSGSNAAAETGLSIANNGQITFAPGQSFPGGSGTITGVTAGAGLTGGGTSGNVTLKLDTSKVPLLTTANTFTGNQTVNGNVSSTGVVTGSTFQIGSDLFGFGSHVNLVSYTGFAGNPLSTGVNNTGVGAFALGSNTIGTDNVAVGTNGLFFNTEGAHNTAVGSQALIYNIIGEGNTAVGYEALYSNTNFSNTAVGYQSLYSNTSGGVNVAVGNAALYWNTTGSANTAAGGVALVANTTGEDNTALGFTAMYSNTTGGLNTAVGYAALKNANGNQLTCIGYECDMGITDIHNATAIGARALANVSDSVVLGSVAGVNGATATARVGIGTTAPTAILTIGRGAGHPVSDSWETYSSRRWKTNIQTLPNALSKVEQLRGVTYDLRDSGKHEIGVIAEEVGAVVPELVTYEENGKDARGVDYSRLTALLIEAVKQQQRQIKLQQRQISQQRAQITRLTQKMGTVEASLRTDAHSGPSRHGYAEQADRQQTTNAAGNKSLESYPKPK